MATKPVPTAPMQTEPAMIVGTITAFVTAAIGLLVAYGLDITEEQKNAVLSMTAVLAPGIAAMVIRSKVYAPATVQELTNDAAVTGEAADTAPPPPTKSVPREKWGVYRDGPPTV